MASREMGEYEDLVQALKSSLESRGVLADLTAKVRAEIFKSLNEGEIPPAQARETIIVNQLILSYLDWHGYANAASVFSAEANVNRETGGPTNEQMGEELGVNVDSYPNDVPILYGLVFRNSARTAVDRVVAPRGASGGMGEKVAADPFLERFGGGGGSGGNSGEVGDDKGGFRQAHHRWRQNGGGVGLAEWEKMAWGADEADESIDAGYVELSK